MAGSFISGSRDSPADLSTLSADSSSPARPQHSPFLARRNRLRAQNKADRSSSVLSSQLPQQYNYQARLYSQHTASHPRESSPQRRSGFRQPKNSDAPSTSSSTLVNLDSNNVGNYLPWEVRSDSSASPSLASHGLSSTSQVTPTLPSLDDIGTIPSIHISPLPLRPASRAPSSASTRRARNSWPSQTTNRLTSHTERQLCPVDCRCSDQDIDIGTCRRVVGSSSSSGSDTPYSSVRMHSLDRLPEPTILAEATAEPPASIQPSIDDDTRDVEPQHANSSESSGRDLRTNPVLIPKSSRSRRFRPSTSSTSLYRSFDRLQRDSNDVEKSQAQRRAESLARWAARRETSLEQFKPVRAPNGQPHVDQPVSLSRSSPRRAQSAAHTSNSATPSTTAFETPRNHVTSPASMSPASGRRSIAAIFESMQKEREARAAEEQRRWKEKQAARERERAARAFGIHSVRGSPESLTASSIDFTAKEESDFSGRNATSSEQPNPLWQSPRENAVRSTDSCGRPPSPPTARSTSTTSPRLSSPVSPRLDDHVAEDVSPRHLQQEAAARIPETLTEEAELESEVEVQTADKRRESTASTAGPDERLVPENANVDTQQNVGTASPRTPQTSSAFRFASQPMALELSPGAAALSSLSNLSSPASSPRKNAHRRQNTGVVSVAARLPAASVEAAQNRLQRALQRHGERDTLSGPTIRNEPVTEGVPPQTPIHGILASAKKRLLGDTPSRGRHSVRFSPRPDYRSDSGSWDESEHTIEQRPQFKADQPLRQILIPDILTSAGVVKPSHDIPKVRPKAEEEATATVSPSVPGPQASSRVDDSSFVSTTTSPDLPEQQNSAQTARQTMPEATDSAPARSFSRSIHLPGAYISTPLKAAARINGLSHTTSVPSVSRHLIRPSPSNVRMKVLDFDALERATTSSSVYDAAENDSDRSQSSASPPPRLQRGKDKLEFGLFPGPDIPRSSTPPPMQESGPAPSTPPSRRRDDPRYSPRSPRPSNLPQSPSTPPRNLDDSVNLAIDTILQTLDRSRRARKSLNFADEIENVRDRVGDVMRSQDRLVGTSPSSVVHRSSPTSQHALEPFHSASNEGHSDDEDNKIDELRTELSAALSALVSQMGRDTTGIGAESVGYEPADLDMKVSFWTSRPKLAVAVVMLTQLVLMAIMLRIAEEKAQRMRMYAPSHSISYSALYRDSSLRTSGPMLWGLDMDHGSGRVEWDPISADMYLTPLLRIPGLDRLQQSFPLLPSAAMLITSQHANDTIWSLYSSHIRVHGLLNTFAQLALYSVAQISSTLVLIALVPLQVAYFIINPMSL
ncbi:hypothetical protein BCV70DRAFT_202718 [Testicularia cyperi]|uniref:Uncharacterized protein n=1 Tax=Testicularia cyperi TaxID=1882483 RepID=A0A317XI88_9BASI|nr:hypothetical protein BCV70DRAFT_202718 [Testicularia cyperi]